MKIYRKKEKDNFKSGKIHMCGREMQNTDTLFGKDSIPARRVCSTLKPKH